LTTSSSFFPARALQNVLISANFQVQIASYFLTGKTRNQEKRLDNSKCPSKQEINWAFNRYVYNTFTLRAVAGGLDHQPQSNTQSRAQAQRTA
jgi:hypothetical protein